MSIIKLSLITLNVVLVIGQLSISHFRATDGDQVAALEAKLATITTHNRQLQSDINVLSSLTAIHSQALESKLTPLPAISFDPLPVAKAP